MTTYAARLERLRHLAGSDVAALDLDVEARRAVGELWARRAEGELTSAATFAGLHRDGLTFGLDAHVSELTARAVDDEHFHGALSLLMAEHYLDRRVPSPMPRADPLRFETCAVELAPALRFLLHCALNETIAVAYLRQCRREGASLLVRAAMRELLHDEIDHSRLGWAFVASTANQPAVRESFCRELPALLALVSEAWCKPVAGAEYPAGHGALTLAHTRAVTDEALRSVILPGLARFGIEPRE